MTLHLKSGGSPFSVSAPFFSFSSVRLSKVLCADFHDNGRFAVCGGAGPSAPADSEGAVPETPGRETARSRRRRTFPGGAHAGNLHTALKSRRRFHGGVIPFRVSAVR